MVIQRFLSRTRALRSLVVAVAVSQGLALAGEVQEFVRIGEEAGISHRSIFALAQDRKGFIWIGTADGLNRFDGRQCRTWRREEENPGSLWSNSVYTIFEDRHGLLWIGTAAGLNRFDRRWEKFERINLSHATGGRNPPAIYAITEDAGGDVWIGGEDLLIHFKSADEYTSCFPDPADPESLPKGAVVQIEQDSEGGLWILSSIWGIRPMILARLRNDGGFSVYSAPSGWERTGGFAVHQSGRFFVNINGVGVFDPGSGHYGGPLFDPLFETMGKTSVDRHGRYLMPASGGLVRFDPEHSTRELLTFSDPQDFLSALPLIAMEDRAGALWVGTRGGLYRSDPHQKSFHHFQHQRGDRTSLAGNQVSAILEGRSGAIWVGTFGGGLNRLEKGGTFNRFRHRDGEPNSLCSDTIWDLAEDSVGILWIGHEKGLCRFDPEKGEFSTVSMASVFPSSGGDSRVSNIVVTPDDGLILGSDFGVFHFDPVSGLIYPFPMENGEQEFCNINALVPGHKDTVWVAGGNACSRLFRLKLDGKESPAALEPVEGIPLESDGTFDLVEDESGIIWLATVSGLGRFDPRSLSYELLTTRDGLPGSTVYSILIDEENRLWLGTNRGLSRFDPAKPGPPTFRNFHLQDGIGSEEFNRHAALAASDGRFYFGGMDGLTVFSPLEICANPVVPPVVVTGIRVWGRHGSREIISHERSEIHLEHDENSLEIRFTALNFTNAEQNRFRYILHGHDLVENDGGTTAVARYSQLRPGRYRFKVKGSNNDGIWNEEGASLSIVIHPPFWQSFWGRGILLLALLAVATGAYRFRVSQLLEVERLRWRIAADLHDDLSSDLSGISLAASLLMRRGLSTRVEVERLSEIERISRSMVDRLRDVVWCVNPEHDSFDAVVRRMRSVVEAMLVDIPYDIEVAAPSAGSTLPMSCRRNLLLIFKEALHNVCRHSAATRVVIELSVREQGLTLEIRDNGIGFEPGVSGNGHGIRNIVQRAKDIGAQLEISSSSGEGTCLRLNMAKIRGGRFIKRALPWRYVRRVKK